MSHLLTISRTPWDLTSAHQLCQLAQQVCLCTQAATRSMTPKSQMVKEGTSLMLMNQLKEYF